MSGDASGFFANLARAAGNPGAETLGGAGGGARAGGEAGPSGLSGGEGAGAGPGGGGGGGGVVDASSAHAPRASDGTPFIVSPLTGKLHYPGPFERIPNGDDRIVLFSPAPGAPPGFQWGQVMGGSLTAAEQENVRFFTRADVISHDPLDNGLVFRFDLYQMGHGISFNIGTGRDGTPLLSYSTLCALYQLPDGSKWAEHVDYFDLDDLQQHAKKLRRRDWRRTVTLPDHDENKELLRLMGRKHTPLSKCEYESWVYTKMEYADQERRGALVGKEAFFWRVEFDQNTLRRGAIHK